MNQATTSPGHRPADRVSLTAFDPVFGRQVARLHGLGSRCLAEFFAELHRGREVTPDLMDRIERFCSGLEPYRDFIKAIGATEISIAPVRAISGSRR